MDENTSKLKTILKEKPLWLKLLPKDNRNVLLNSNESFTVYQTIVDLLGIPIEDKIAIEMKKKVLKDPFVTQILNELTEWKKVKVSGHNDPRYMPNQLFLLSDWGITIQDSEKIKDALNILLDHIDEKTGQFLYYGEVYNRKTKEKKYIWDSLLCDHHLITSLMIINGLERNNVVVNAVKRIKDLITETENGLGWKCLPSLFGNFRGPGRKNELCPMVIIDVLRGFYLLPEKMRPKELIDIGKTLLNCWSDRGQAKPYMFGHGRNFRRLRPPFFWYNIGSVLDATSHYPELVNTDAFKEMLSVALLSFDKEGKITPKSIKTYFKGYSFGQKKVWSPWMTFYLSRICKRAVKINPKIVQEVNKLDGTKFKGSKGAPKKKK
jgi:hypothetical protein